MKHFYCILIGMLLLSIPATGQQLVTYTPNHHAKPKIIEQKVFFDIYAGYDVKIGQLDPEITNPFGARSGLKIGFDFKFKYPTRNNESFALGLKAELVTCNKSITSVELNKFSHIDMPRNTNNYFIGPSLTFMQRIKNSFIYEEVSVGYSYYRDKVENIGGYKIPQVITKGDNVAYKLGIGYCIGRCDFKLMLTLGKIEYVSMYENSVPSVSGYLAESIKLNSLSFTVGFAF